MSALITLIQSLIGVPIPSQSSTITIIEGGVTTVTTIANGYDLQYILMAVLLVLFFTGFFILLNTFQKLFGGIKK